MPARPPFPAPDSPALPLPVAIYTRVSTDNQTGGRFDSCESQAAYCREEIERQRPNGWQEVVCLTDAAYSGSTLDRPGIRTLKRMIEAGEVKVVLIYKLERVLRSTDEWVPFKAFLKKHGCRLASATEDISEATPSGRLKNNLMMSFAQYERENTAEKTKAKMVQQAKRGIWNGGLVPMGYVYDKNTQTLNIEPAEAEIVRRVFDDAARLVSLTDIANNLNAAGHRTKARVWQRRDGSQSTVGGRKFRSDGIRLLIQNPIYRGAVRFDGHEYSAKHPALVTGEVWEKANAAASVVEPRPEHLFRDRDVHNHLLKGLAWCGSCGRALVPNDSGKRSSTGVKYRYYTCSLVMRETAAAPCSVGRLSADALEGTVTTLIGEASKHPAIVSAMIAKSRTMARGDRSALRAELEQLKKTLDGLDQQLRNCADAVAKGGAAALGEALTRRATELRTERQALLVQQEHKRRELTLSDATLLEEKRIVENLREIGGILPNLTPEQRKELVRLFVQRVDVARAKDAAPADAARIMEVRVKLHLAELVRGMAERGKGELEKSRVEGRGLNLVGRVDFRHAQRGEVSITAPFQHTLRLDHRMRQVTPPKPVLVHPILRAFKWQQMLDEQRVPHRLGLAKHLGLTPGAVTKMLRLIKLVPQIQAFLAGLKTRREIWHFSLTRMGSLADLAPEMQLAAFEKMHANFSTRQAEIMAASKQVPLPTVATVSSKKRGLGLSAE